MELSWSHVFVPVNDMPKMLDFYTRVLNFRISDKVDKEGKDHMVFLSHLDTEHHQLALMDTGKRLDSRRQGVHFAFRTDSLDTVRSLYQRLTEQEGIAEISPVTHGNTWSIYLADPEGNGLEIFCDTPWQVDQPFSNSWDPYETPEEIQSKTLESISDKKGFKPNVRLGI